MDNRKLVQLAVALQHKSAAEVETILGQKHLDPQERIAVKVEMAAAATGRTMQAGFTLATDGAESRPLSEMARTMQRLGLAAGETITLVELEARMTAQGLTAQQRIAVKVEAAERGVLAQLMTLFRSEVLRVLDVLAISRPISRSDLDERLDVLGIDQAALRQEVRQALQERGFLAAGGRRTLRASAARPPTRLVDRQGQAITLKSRPE